ncbi:EpsG family protein [Bacteroides intestinalis]|uniref:EpsG family protein n=1 Tax=Bacteroides intestinalis TaxID=329854 RepID=A0A139L3E7_9BACE|nr:EpsG family protein [Bacteroides intestinalis]KXT45982.1 hypothetical protein HMPREF2531_03302 [Bacteroides intestinalis]
MFYFIIFFFLFAFSFAFIDKKINSIWGVAIALLLIFIAGGRYMCGADYGSYENMFNEISWQNFYFVEPLFGILIALVKYIGGFNLFLLFIAALSVSLKFWVINKYSPYPLFSYAILFVGLYVSLDMGQIRQGLGLSICWFSIQYLEKRPFVFFFLILLGIGVHFSAFVFAGIYFLRNINFSVKKAFLGIFFCFCIGKIMSLLVHIVMIDNPLLQFKIDTYVDNEDYGKAIGFNVGMLIKLVLLYILLIYKKRIIAEQQTANILINAYILGNFVYFFLLFNEIIAGRFSLYFIYFDIILVPIISKYIISQNSRTLFISLYFLFLFYQLYVRLYLTNGTDLIPYHNFLIG